MPPYPISTSVSVFVDNLPYEMDSVWLRQLFRPFGDVTDVYIPKKKSSSFHTKLEFVRFKSREEANRAVQELDGLRIRDFPIQVNLARYPQSSRNVVPSQNSGVPFASIKNRPSYAFKDKCRFNSDFVENRSLSFADIVSGKKPSASCLSVKVRDGDYQWLSMSAIAKLPSQRSLESLREAFISEGVWNVQIRQMGGNFVLLTFESTDHMKSMLEGGGLCWLLNFFDEVKQWEPEPVTEYYRVVWLNCYGIPLNVWNVDTFFSIGRLWGEVITLDEDTSTRSSLSVGKVKISTKAFEVINHIVNLELNGKVFPVRVVEEQVGVNSFIKAICECNGANLVKHVSPSESGVKPGTKEGVDGGDDDDDDMVRNLVLSNVGENDQVLSLSSGEALRVDDGDQGSEFLAIQKDLTNKTSVGVINGDKGDTFVISNKGDQALLSNIDVGDNSLLFPYSFVEESSSPLGINHCTERSIHVEDCKGANHADGATASSGSDDSLSADLVSADPLVNYMDYLRHRKKARSKKGFRRNPIWTKNPLKAAIVSRTFSRNRKEEKSKSFKSGSKKGSLVGPTLSNLVEASSDIRKRYTMLIKEARKNMEMGASCGVKFYGRDSYNIKKYLEIQGVDISELEIKALEDLEEGTSISMEF